MPDDNDEDFFQELREGKFDEANINVIDEIIWAAGIGSDPETDGITRTTVQDALDVMSQKDAGTPTKKSKSKRVAYSVACTLHVSGSDYQVQPLPGSSDYDKAYRLNKMNAQKPTGYNVIQKDGVIICECSDFRFRQDGSDSKGCKHIRALVDLGFFSTPTISKRMGSHVFDE
jgi:hypothetical protein